MSYELIKESKQMELGDKYIIVSSGFHFFEVGTEVVVTDLLPKKLLSKDIVVVKGYSLKYTLGLTQTVRISQLKKVSG